MNDGLDKVIARISIASTWTIITEPMSDPNMLTSGLTKREHFAGLAMRGLMDRDDFCMDEDVISKMALWSTQCADALLAELEK